MNIIVTGAAGALGEAVADRLCEVGSRVALVDLIEGKQRPHSTWIRAADLADPEEALKAIGGAAKWLGSIDALVHLVGGFEWKLVGDTTLADWRTLYSANVEAAVSTIQAALPHLEDGAAIVAVGAASAQPAGAGMAPYAAAKAGVARLCEALAKELAPRRIRVNCILPSIIDTPRNRTDMPEADFAAWTSPAAIADAIQFLTSPASRAVNGASLEVSNGA
jgi:NAD(P)-dependent dehydrogenase (short-subunit alcohol dehydrogenase family)